MKRYKYTVGQLSKRLLQIAAAQKKMLILGTIGSVIGNAARLSLMGSGACMILFVAGKYKSGSYLQWLIIMALSALVIAGMRYLEGVASHVAAYSLLANMRTELFRKLRTLAPACLVDREKGDVISVAISDVDTIEKFFAHTIGPMFTVIILPCITIVYAGSIHPLFAWTLIPLYVIISVIIPLAAMAAGRNMGANYRKQLGKLKSLVLETVYGLKDIQIFGIGQRKLTEICKHICGINKTAHGMTIHKQLVTAVPEFFIHLSRVIIVVVATYLAIGSDMELSRVVVLSAIVSASFSSTQSLISVVSSLLETFAAAERLFEIYDETPAVTEKDNAVYADCINEIEFSGVTFRYKKDSSLVLNDVNLKINKGDKIGIIGPSGAGKSTILRLLLRFWDPTTGNICADDTTLKNVTFRSLRDRIAHVEQQTFIFNDTVAANISLGKPTASEDEIRLAAKRAGIANLIERLPDGYNTQLGEFGSRLSGGERQRIGIARVMLVNPDVIVMDEPTSSLDIFNEKVLLKTLEDEYDDKTIIIVSHRRSTLTGCDRLIKLSNGKLSDVAHY